MRARDLIACVATLAAASSVAVVASRAAAEDEREADANAYGFDHLLHEGKVAVSGAEPIDCSTCHSVDASGAINGFPGHSACYGACHGETPRPRVIPRSGDAAPYPIADGRKRTCENCHSPAVLDRVIAGSRDPLAASYPPYRVDPDYGLVMSHPKHATATADARSCRTCHEVPADVGGANGKTTATTRAPHARCVGCHINPSDPTTPTMSQCTTCHLGAYGPAARPHHSPGEFTTRSAFSHAAHLSRADSKCVTCHTAVATTEGIVLPTPTKAECAACHDGDAAFSMLDARVREAAREARRSRQPPPPRRAQRDRMRRLPLAERHGRPAATSTESCPVLRRGLPPRAVRDRRDDDLRRLPCRRRAMATPALRSSPARDHRVRRLVWP